MATHSIILAWRVPWIEEPGGLQSRGMQRVRYNCMRCPSVLGELRYLDLQSLGKNKTRLEQKNKYPQGMTRKLPSDNHNADNLDSPIQNETKTQDKWVWLHCKPQNLIWHCYKKSNHCLLSSLYVSVHYINSPLIIVSVFFFFRWKKLMLKEAKEMAQHGYYIIEPISGCSFDAKRCCLAIELILN